MIKKTNAIFIFSLIFCFFVKGTSSLSTKITLTNPNKYSSIVIKNYSPRNQLVFRTNINTNAKNSARKHISRTSLKIEAIEAFDKKNRKGHALILSSSPFTEETIFELCPIHENDHLWMMEEKDTIEIAISSLTEFSIKGKTFKFCDSHPNSFSTEWSKKEILEDKEYNLEDLTCKNGDVMIDIGAHVGIVSIIYAILYPQLTIYAFEPEPRNYKALLLNLMLNNVTNVIPCNKAVSGDGLPLEMHTDPHLSAGATQQKLSTVPKKESFMVESQTLDHIFKEHHIDKCKILKIDCEGSEYEIITNTSPETIKKCDYLMGEFHINSLLEEKGYSITKLMDYIFKCNENLVLKVTSIRTNL